MGAITFSFHPLLIEVTLAVTVLLPTGASRWKLPGGVDVNRAQVRLITGYNMIDPGCELLGYHYGRPVVWSFLSRYRDVKYERRHVIVIQRNGDPGAPPANWQDNFYFLPEAAGSGARFASRRQRVRDIIDDYMSWSTRS